MHNKLHTKEAKLKMRKAHLGYHLSDEAKLKLSKIAKERGFGKKGHIPWNKGKKGLQKFSKETRKKMSEVRKGKHHSKETRKKISEAKKGSNNPNWKGGISLEYKRIRASVEFRLWREAVFVRDNFICQKCGERGEKLHPHHIQNFSQFIELRFAIDNGITLCEKCHKEFHKTYGNKNNTKEQIDEFLLLKG